MSGGLGYSVIFWASYTVFGILGNSVSPSGGRVGGSWCGCLDLPAAKPHRLQQGSERWQLARGSGRGLPARVLGPGRVGSAVGCGRAALWVGSRRGLGSTAATHRAVHSANARPP